MVLEHPSRTVFAAAAFQNELVQAFIAEALATWSPERVERDPPFYLVYELGEVVGNLSDLPIMERHAAKHGGLGERLGFRALRPHDEVLAYTSVSAGSLHTRAGCGTSSAWPSSGSSAATAAPSARPSGVPSATSSPGRETSGASPHAWPTRPG